MQAYQCEPIIRGDDGAHKCGLGAPLTHIPYLPQNTFCPICMCVEIFHVESLSHAKLYHLPAQHTCRLQLQMLRSTYTGSALIRTIKFLKHSYSGCDPCMAPFMPGIGKNDFTGCFVALAFRLAAGTTRAQKLPHSLITMPSHVFLVIFRSCSGGASATQSSTLHSSRALDSRRS